MNRKTQLSVENLEGKALLSATPLGAVQAISLPIVHHVDWSTWPDGLGLPPSAVNHTNVAVSPKTAVSQNGLLLTLTTDKSSYSLGSPVKMTFTEKNTSNHPIKVVTGPSVNGFIITQNGVVVWKSSLGIQSAFMRVQTLQPGQSITLTATWTATKTGTFSIHEQTALLGPTATFTVS